MNNEEFIKQRTFEIAWAVFRCAALFKQQKMKSEFENSAVEVLAEQSYEKKLFLYDKLEQIIRLAEAIDEIKIINSSVLFREINNIKEIISKEIGNKKITAESSVEIKDIFSNSFANSVNDDNSAIRQSKEEKAGEQTTQKPKNNALELDSNSYLNKLKTRQLITENNSAMNEAAELPNYHEQASSGEKQQAIFEKIKDIGRISTRELMFIFPDISERTLRFYLQKLIERGLVEKMGSTGPGSYYILKRTQEV